MKYYSYNPERLLEHSGVAHIHALPMVQESCFIERIEDIFATIQDEAAASCSQSPVLPGNAPSA